MKHRSLTDLREEMRAVARGERNAPARPTAMNSSPKTDPENPEGMEAGADVKIGSREGAKDAKRARS
jgi:hypothetical protein